MNSCRRIDLVLSSSAHVSASFFWVQPSFALSYLAFLCSTISSWRSASNIKLCHTIIFSPCLQKNKVTRCVQIHLWWYCHWTWNCLNLRYYDLIGIFPDIFFISKVAAYWRRRWMFAQVSGTKHVQSLHVREGRHVLCDSWNTLKYHIFIGLERYWVTTGEGCKKGTALLRKCSVLAASIVLRLYDWIWLGKLDMTRNWTLGAMSAVSSPMKYFDSASSYADLRCTGAPS